MSPLLPHKYYPEQLKPWVDGNRPLWYLGDHKILNLPMISIIGTRAPSPEGVKNAMEVAKILVSQSFCVVSGMAKGIDTAAHSSTLDSGGNTIAVMGTSIQECYPKENANLKDKIINSGLVLSQFSPERKTSRYNFPKRNELMAELSLASIVVEAGPKSGVQHQLKKTVQLKKKIIFFKNLVEKNYNWVSQYLKYKNCLVFSNISDFEAWVVCEKENSSIPGCDGEGEGGIARNSSKAYSDASGYLNELENKVNKKWFSSMCKMALDGLSQLSEARLKQLEGEFFEKDLPGLIELSNKRICSENEEKGEQGSLFNFKLNHIGNFRNFKGLSKNIYADFNTPITVIFGANGSGKSSLCYAIKQLSGGESDSNISLNVMHPSNESPSFEYQFLNDTKVKKCISNRIPQEKVYRDKIKYFDPSISRSIIINNHDSKKIVSVLAFNLEVFDRLQSCLGQFREYLQRSLAEKQRGFTKVALALKSNFTQDNVPHMDVYDDVVQGRLDRLESLINQQEKNQNIEEEIDKIEEKLTAIGGKLSPAHKVRLDEQQKQLDKVLTVVSRLWSAYGYLLSLKPQETLQKYRSLREKQKAEISYLVPNENKIQEFKEFLKYSQKVVNYEKEDNKHCIFCKQELDDKSIRIIQSYQKFLQSNLEQEIELLENNIQKYNEKRKHIANYDFGIALQPIPEPISYLKNGLMNKIESIKEFCKKDPGQVLEVQDTCRHKITLDSEMNSIKKSLRDISQKLKNFEQESEQLKKEAERLRVGGDKLKLKRGVAKYKGDNRLLHQNIKEYTKLKSEIDSENFTALIRNATRASNEARRNLIVDTFIRNLNKHYRELAEKSLESSGISLKPVKRDNMGDIRPEIKGKYKLKEVLSEGEQKIYSLALFFAELDHEKRPVVVFDDPVSSLDYTYAGNISRKIKNFSEDNPNKQIIIFTHDWYFLKDMQDNLARSRLEENKDFSVYILSDCNEIYLNVENESKIQQKIEFILGNQTPLSRDDKDTLSLSMRKLIEVIINKYVFNNQRTQYKRDKINPAMFHEYTKLRPLDKGEARILTELYSKFSPSLHDNPVSDFQKIDKEVFKSRYEQIKAVRAKLKQSNSAKDNAEKLSLDDKLLASKIQSSSNLVRRNSKVDKIPRNAQG